MEVITVNLKDTTRECGNMQNLQLSERAYICNRYGLQIDRENASINIPNRDTAGHAGSCARKIYDTTIARLHRRTENILCNPQRTYF